MLREQILGQPPKALSQSQRECYFDRGYLLLESFVSEHWLNRLRAVVGEFVEESRNASESTRKFDLEPDHCADAPRLRRLMAPVDHHELFREFTFRGPIVDVAEDLLGPSVRYHHSKLNFKWADGGEEVKWHQDIQYWPHTDFSPLTIGVYLEDVDEQMGPMGVVPGSQAGELFDLYDEEDRWTGSIRDTDISRAHVEQAVFLEGPAGSVTVHNCCMVHGSLPNRSPRTRPLLLQTYAAGDAFPLLTVGVNGAEGRISNVMVRGPRARWMQVGERTVPVAPDWSGGGYTSIFDVQQNDGGDAAAADAG